ncbi:MAG TPA: TRAP transporter TatT component family protein [Myxococcales bacterium]|nr:TRAP transporter TatT component family protein [Myxococcales bacterium]
MRASPIFLRPPHLLLAGWLCAAALGCSPKRMALKATADALSSQSGPVARDDDPELVHEATPFALMTMESLADELEDHIGLRIALASGFSQYAYAFVQEEADEVADSAPAKAKALRARALRLYLRARDYGFAGMRLAHGITPEQLGGTDEVREKALRQIGKDEVSLLYWTLVPWASAISLNKRDLELVGDVPAIAALLDRALALDESYGSGALHEFALAFDSARPSGTTPEAQKKHYQRAAELQKGMKISALVSYAENVLAPAQDKKAFEKVLREALSFDVDALPARDFRLANLIAQRRARYLLAHESDLISVD